MQVHFLAHATAVRGAEDRVRLLMSAGGCFLLTPTMSPTSAYLATTLVRMPGNPRRYRHTSYHKQTKNQWARDDPAFVIICSLLVAAAATAYCVT